MEYGGGFGVGDYFWIGVLFEGYTHSPAVTPAKAGAHLDLYPSALAGVLRMWNHFRIGPGLRRGDERERDDSFV